MKKRERFIRGLKTRILGHFGGQNWSFLGYFWPFLGYFWGFGQKMTVFWVFGEMCSPGLFIFQKVRVLRGGYADPRGENPT